MNTVLNILDLGISVRGKKLLVDQSEGEYFLIAYNEKTVEYFYFDFFELNKKELNLEEEIFMIDFSNEGISIETRNKFEIYDFHLDPVSSILKGK